MIIRYYVESNWILIMVRMFMTPKIGNIGNGETAIGRSNQGNNYIEAKFSGIQGIGMNGTQANFVRSGRENKYFLIKMTSGLFKNKIQMFEVNESTFKSSF